MAPTPVESDLLAIPTPTALPPRIYWTKVNIALTIVSAALFLWMIAGLLIFCIHQRIQKRNLLARQQSSDEARLLTHDDRSSMFSRHHAGSSVTLCIDPEADSYKKPNTDTISLVALQITPPPPPQQSLKPTIHHKAITTAPSSTGSSSISTSNLSTTTTTSTMSPLHLSPLSLTATDPKARVQRASRRPHSSSISSQRARYYETTPADMTIPPVPAIVHRPSGLSS